MSPHFVTELTRRLAAPCLTLGVPIALTLVVAFGSGLLPIHAANANLATFSAVSFAESDGGAGVFPDSTAASTGFTSIPTARALFKSPRWIAAAQAPGPILAQTPARDRLALVVLGMPVDIDHDMLRGTTIQSDCLTSGQAGRTMFSSCKGTTKLYERFSSGGRYNLCDYDEDCWHSSAVALLALGNATQPNSFLLRGQQASAKFHDTTFSAIAHHYYKDYVSASADGASSFQHFLQERFSGFGRVMNVTLPVATLTYGGDISRTTYITKPMMIDRGIDPGAPLLAVNVFSYFDDDECRKHHKEAPCLLTTTAAQEQALRHILNDLAGADPARGGTRLRLGAIVIIAGGYLTAGRCDDTTTAWLIGELRRRGILTFVAAGNDGDPTHVRFPACASQAIAIGSLTRDGAIAPSSNGSRTGMVSLYVDGETVAMPIRGPRVLGDSAMGVRVGARLCQDTRSCHMRAPGDQYDAYLAGGTLLSTAVASGIFLDLRQRYPSVPPDAVLGALRSNKLLSNPAFAEIDERAAAQRLAAHALPY